jgi:hypothetical protein
LSKCEASYGRGPRSRARAARSGTVGDPLADPSRSVRGGGRERQGDDDGHADERQDDHDELPDEQGTDAKDDRYDSGDDGGGSECAQWVPHLLGSVGDPTAQWEGRYWRCRQPLQSTGLNFTDGGYSSAGQNRWAGAGSNRRPSAFQAGRGFPPHQGMAPD